MGAHALRVGHDPDTCRHFIASQTLSAFGIGVCSQIETLANYPVEILGHDADIWVCPDFGRHLDVLLIQVKSRPVVARTYARLRKEIAAKSSLPVRAFLASSQSAVVARVASSLKSIDDRETKLRGVAVERDVAEKEARAKFAEQAAIAEKRRKAEEVQRKAAEKLAAQEAARQRAANATKSPTPAPKPRITKPQAPAPKKSSGGKSGGKSGGSYPGYTGPRCYAPGGKTWRPC